MLAGPAPGSRVGTAPPWLPVAAGLPVPVAVELPAVGKPAVVWPPVECALGVTVATAAPGSMPIAHAVAASTTSVRRCLDAGLDRPDTNASFTGAAGLATATANRQRSGSSPP